MIRAADGRRPCCYSVRRDDTALFIVSLIALLRDAAG